MEARILQELRQKEGIGQSFPFFISMWTHLHMRWAIRNLKGNHTFVHGDDALETTDLHRLIMDEITMMFHLSRRMHGLTLA